MDVNNTVPKSEETKNEINVFSVVLIQIVQSDSFVIVWYVTNRGHKRVYFFITFFPNHIHIFIPHDTLSFIR